MHPKLHQALFFSQVSTADPVLLLDAQHFEESLNDHLSHQQLTVILIARAHYVLDFAFEESVEVLRFWLILRTHTVVVACDFLTQIFQLTQLQNIAVRISFAHIRVFHGVTCESQAEARGVSGVLFAELFNGEEIPLRLGHLLPINHDPSIAKYSLWKVLLLPHIQMVVQTHGQVVFDQVLSRTSQVKRIPIFEALSHHFQRLLRDLARRVVLCAQKDVVPI